ncbi:MAG: CoA transferase subunit A [Alphaproteobacteria bacterium]|nr:CoA transferase subunit A [Alphaproteobacteria bacterium]
MVKFITAEEATHFFKNGQIIMVGGFLNCGNPQEVIAEILKTNLKDFTLIANDTSTPEDSRGKLVVAHKIKKAIVSHIGTNPETVRQYNTKEIEIDLQPQGTLAERIRAAGAGLGGILTPVGLNTDVANNKTVISVENKDYLLETPLKADIAIVYATYADKFGNLAFHGSTKNFNVLMPMAADVVIVEAEHISEQALSPDNIVVPGIFVDYMVKKEKDGID